MVFHIYQDQLPKALGFFYCGMHLWKCSLDKKNENILFKCAFTETLMYSGIL